MTRTKTMMAIATLAATIAGCGGVEPGPAVPAQSNNGFEGIGSTELPLLAALCAVDNTGKYTIAIAAGETLYVTLRPTDGKITLNANIAANTQCVMPANAPLLTVSATGNGNHAVILDYVNGLFMKATSTPLIAIDLGSMGTGNSVKIRGSNGVDRYAVGAGTAGAAAFNINFGTNMTTPVGDAFPDVSWKNVQSVVISTGPGNDVIDGTGTTANGVGTIYTGALQLFGGAGNDTINGGSGNDTIVPGDGNDTVDGNDGNDTIKMGAASDGDDIINVASMTPGSDTVDYSARTNNLTLLVDGTSSTSGETNEKDKLSDKIVNIIGGAGDDIITIGATSAVSHNVFGGPGNDTLTGSTVSGDMLDGQSGDDTMIGDKCTADYSGRATGVTVTVCTGSCNGSNDDGEQASTYVVNTGLAATLGAPTGLDADSGANTATVTLLAHMTAKSVGRTVTITGSSGGTNDGVYPIVAYISATSVTIDVTSNNTYAGGEASLAWSEKGPEADNVQCIHVNGSAQNDIITGDARNNILTGNDGNDILTGGAGDDILWGGNGNDELYGSAGADTLDGAAGTDILVGGDDNDVLSGGLGADTFTCDGKNTKAGAVGTSPGDSDFTVDYDVSQTDSKGSDCDF